MTILHHLSNLLPLGQIVAPFTDGSIKSSGRGAEVYLAGDGLGEFCLDPIPAESRVWPTRLLPIALTHELVAFRASSCQSMFCKIAGSQVHLPWQDRPVSELLALGVDLIPSLIVRVVDCRCRLLSVRWVLSTSACFSHKSSSCY